jgi:hypothetical protein
MIKHDEGERTNLPKKISRSSPGPGLPFVDLIAGSKTGEAISQVLSVKISNEFCAHILQNMS